MRQDHIASSRINRRGFLRHVGVAATTAAALSTGAATWGTPAPAADAATTLTIWEFAENRGRWLSSLAPGFRKLYPQANITIVSIPYAAIYSKLATALLSGSGAPDLAEMAVGRMGQFFIGGGGANGGQTPFVPLNDKLGARKTILNVASAFKPWTYQGHIYAVGNEYNPVLMYYRWDLFQKAGINVSSIKTWSDFVSAGKEFKAKTGAYMVALPVTNAANWYFIARQRGGGYFDEAGHIIVNNDVGVSTLQYLRDLVYKHNVAILAPGLTQYPPNAAYFTAMSKGVFGVAMDGVWYEGFMKDSAPTVAGKFQIAPIPMWDSNSTRSVINGGTGLAITQQTPNKDLAWKFIEYAMLQPQSQLQAFTLENILPDMLSLYSNPALSKPDPYFHNQKPAQIARQVGNSVAGWIENPYQAQMDDAMARLAITPVMQGHKSAKQGLDDVAAAVKKAIKG